MGNRGRILQKAIELEDVQVLKELGKTGPGFMNSEFRRKCWPLILNCCAEEEIKEGPTGDISVKDKNQVAADVKRSFLFLPRGTSCRERAERQRELSEVILTILKNHPNLSYYQGFHDVCSCFLAVLGKEMAIRVVEKIVLGPLRDAMHESLSPFMQRLSLVGDLVRQEDAHLYKILEESGVFPVPTSCISWLITWCSHDLRDLEKLGRLFDFFISSDADMCAFFTASVILDRRNELLSSNGDQGQIHLCISTFPSEANLDKLLERTLLLYKKYCQLSNPLSLLSAKLSSLGKLFVDVMSMKYLISPFQDFIIAWNQMNKGGLDIFFNNSPGYRRPLI